MTIWIIEEKEDRSKWWAVDGGEVYHSKRQANEDRIGRQDWANAHYPETKYRVAKYVAAESKP